MAIEPQLTNFNKLSEGKMETCLKYQQYTNEGKQIIRRYFSGISQHEDNNQPNHFVWTEDTEHDEAWISDYANGDKCRFCVGIEEMEITGCRQEGRGINTRWTWGTPVTEYRVVVRDYFNDNLVFSRHTSRDNAVNDAQKMAVRFGFDYWEPDDSEFLASLQKMVRNEVDATLGTM